MEIPAERHGRRARRRRHQQHSGRAALASAACRCSMRRARTRTRSRNWCSPACSSRRATSARPGTTCASSRATTTQLEEAVEQGKKKFVGYELPGRTLGVIGLGAIGVEVANAAHLLGMRVLGFDPQITVQRAWQLSSGVEQALSLDDLFARCDMITVHVPLIDATRGLVNAARLRLMKRRRRRAELRARAASSTKRRCSRRSTRGKLGAYVCDFPTDAAQGSSEGRGAAAPRRLDRRGRGELRDHGRGHAARLPRERQRPQFGQLSRGGAAAHRRARRACRSPTRTCRTWSARSPPRSRRRSSTSPTC